VSDLQYWRTTSTVGQIPRATASAYFGASNAKEFANWQPSLGSADSDLLPDLETLRIRSRDLGRNNGIASGAIQTHVDNVVGTGPRLSAIPDYRALGKSKEWAVEWSTWVESLWREYFESCEIDAAGMLDGAGMTEQVFRSGMLNGEALALPLWLPRSRSRWATRFQLVESDRLSTPSGRNDSERLRAGIEIDEYGRPLAYWIQKAHPGDTYISWGIGSSEWTRIPAETDWGRPRVLHIHDKERTGQSRGKPMLSSVISEFRMFDHYKRTTLQSAVVNAMVAAFIETPLDGATIAEMLGSDPNSQQYQNYLAMQREYTAPLRGAAIIPTPPGTQIKPFIPGHPTDAFGPFTENIARGIGAATGLPLELLMKDFSKTNYSSARASLLEAWRFFKSRRKWLQTYWLKPVYAMWLEEAVSNGSIEAPDFLELQYAWTRCKWIWPGRGWIDPVKEAEAAALRIKNKVSTLEDECAEQGLDYREVLEQQAVEMALMQELGLPAIDAKPEPGRPPQQQQEEEEAVPA
jgi:lambda family phage portal protein